MLEAVCIENGHLVLVEPVVIHPREQADCALPYSGRTPQEYLLLCANSEIDYVSWDINLTNNDIIVYRGVWKDTANNAGYFWSKHLRFLLQGGITGLK